MVGGGTEARVQAPHEGNCLELEEKHLRLRVKQLISGNLWNENQTVHAAAICTPVRDTGPLEGIVARSWSLRKCGAILK